MIDADKRAYTHILYLKPKPETIVEQVANDSAKQRPQLDVAIIRQWQDFEEEEELRSVCRDNDILFLTIEPEMVNQTKAIAQLLQDAARHDETINDAIVNRALDSILQSRPSDPIL